MIGGSGSTLALVVLLLVLGKKGSAERSIGKVSIIPGLFGINEPVTFGLPIILIQLCLFHLYLYQLLMQLLDILQHHGD